MDGMFRSAVMSTDMTVCPQFLQWNHFDLTAFARYFYATDFDFPEQRGTNMATIFRTNQPAGFRKEDLVRRIRQLENQLAFLAGSASARGQRAAVDAGQGMSAALTTLASQFRNGANWM